MKRDTMEPPDFLVCARIDEAERVIPGSVDASCCRCSVLCWVSPSGQHWMRLADVICTNCALELPKSDEMHD